MSKRIFKAQFERDLEFLRSAIVRYQETGKPGNLFPALFRAFSHIWTLRGVLKREFLEYYG